MIGVIGLISFFAVFGQWSMMSSVICVSVCVQKGAGDFIGGMKFCPSDLSKVYVASGEGSLTLQSFEGLPSQTLSRTQDCGHTHHNVW